MKYLLAILLLMSSPAIACDDPPDDQGEASSDAGALPDSEPPFDGPTYGSGSSKGNGQDH